MRRARQGSSFCRVRVSRPSDRFRTLPSSTSFACSRAPRRRQSSITCSRRRRMTSWRSSPRVHPESDRRRLLHVQARATTKLARTQPVFLSFEDVHWSDDATLELVFHLARTHVSLPVVIALTYRGEEARSEEH